MPKHGRSGNQPYQGSRKKKKTTHTGSAASAAFRRDVAAGRFAGFQRNMKAGEKKGMDTVVDLADAAVVATTNTNDASFVLNLIQAGNGSWNRVGRKAYLQSVRLRGIATCLIDRAATTGNLLANTLRMVLVWDKQPSSGSVPAFDVIFGKTVQAGTESCTFLDSLRYDNTDRFKVLRDVVVCASPQTDNAASDSTNATRYDIPFDEFVKLGQRETQFSGQSTPMTIADISTGALYVYFRASRNDNTSLWSIGNSVARLRYTD